MPRLHQAGRYPGCWLELLIVFHADEVLRHHGGVFLRIERLDQRLAMLLAALVDERHIRLLDVPRIDQHDVRQVGGRLCGEDRTAEAGLDQAG